jgi:hypothetical protein
MLCSLLRNQRRIKMKLVFGGLVAVILLALYVYALSMAVYFAWNGTPALFTDGFSTTLSTVGGLVSALVIAELAITKPGEAPVSRAMSAQDGTSPAGNQKRILVLLTGAYVLLWITSGVAAYVIGVMQKPGIVESLTSFGKSWLGLAVAAGYAYFGINQKS